MRTTFVTTLVLALSVQLVGTAVAAPAPGAEPGHDHSSHDHRSAELPTPDAARGVVNRGLTVATEGPCLGLLEVVDVPGAVCTHGPDAAPVEVGDVRTAEFDADQTLEEASTTAPFTCNGDGVSGRRAHAIYAVTADRTDRFTKYEEAFKAVIASVQDEYRQSSLLHGATDPAVFRFTHTTPVDGTCEPLLDHVVLPDPTDDDSFGATINALTELGYTDPSRRYLVFADANLLCGIGQMYGDDRADPTKNYNNLEYQPLFSRVDAGCWGYAETHELTHNIGGVQSSAPHASGAGHCNDDHDLMCYSDGGSLSALFIADECTLKSLWERRLDCNGDDYFNPAPPADSYLATHWNTWNSGWLFREVAPTDDGTTDTTTDTTTDDTDGTTDGTSDDTDGSTDDSTSGSDDDVGVPVLPPSGAVRLTGDWDGDGVDTPGWFKDGRWGLHDSHSSTGSTRLLSYGRAGDVPVVGDWNGDGNDTIGVVRGNTWILRYEYRSGADIVMKYGRSTDKPVTGDWNGDGRDTIGVVRGNEFILRYEYRSGADIVLRYGRSTDKPVTGDWNGDGRDTIGVVRGNEFILRYEYRSGADIVLEYGRSTDKPVTGDWNGDGRDTLGVVRGSKWILRYVYRSGADYVYFY